MSSDTVKSLLELVDERPDVDNSEVFPRLWAILGEVRAKLDKRFTLQMDESTRELQPYEKGDYQGFLSTFYGAEIEHMVHSWIGNPKQSFCNMHLTTWLKPHINVPHLGFALGTLPDVFIYMDYIPRVDLWTDLDYLDRYYEPANERFLALRKDQRLSPFTSKTLYMRQSQSSTSNCYVFKATDDTLELVREMAHEMVDRWLVWVDEAPPVPEAQRAALAARDLFIRRAIADRDPANAMGVRLFGEELTEKLVRALWGANRAGL
jgi:hypothetical protein